MRVVDSEGGTTAREISAATLSPKRTVQRKIKEMIPARVVKAPLKGGYQLSLEERAKMERFKAEQETEPDEK